MTQDPQLQHETHSVATENANGDKPVIDTDWSSQNGQPQPCDAAGPTQLPSSKRFTRAFLNPTRVHDWSAAVCARAIADLYARFPTLRGVFCANRKIPETWTRNYITTMSPTANTGSPEVESDARHDDDADDNSFDVDEPDA